MTTDEAKEKIDEVLAFLYHNTDCSMAGATRFLDNLRSLIKYWSEAEDENTPERTCYNCKHGAYGFDSDLGCSLWHHGNPDPATCEYWEGARRKDKWEGE